MKVSRHFWAGVSAVMAVGLSMVLSSCHKDNSKPFVNPMYYQYFPLKVGAYRIYDADSTLFYTTRQEVHFQLKEVVNGTTKNNAGETEYLIQRYIRHDSSSAWQFVNVFTERQTALEAVRQEGNINYVKMVYPVQKDRSWNANKYNTDDSLNFLNSQYTEVHVPYQLNNMHFDSTAQVELENNEDFISLNKYYERYAANIGLISLDRKELEIQPGQHSGDPADTSGYYYTQTLIDYSK